jgi:hypothetical protein
MVKFDFIIICYMGSSDLGLCFYLCVGIFPFWVLYSMTCRECHLDNQKKCLKALYMLLNFSY